MKAEQFLRHQLNTPEFVSDTDDVNEEYRVIAGIIEEYHKAKINEITDDFLNKQFDLAERELGMEYEKIKHIKWFQEQLLK